LIGLWYARELGLSLGDMTASENKLDSAVERELELSHDRVEQDGLS
jgi:hypothetical protein